LPAARAGVSLQGGNFQEQILVRSTIGMALSLAKTIFFDRIGFFPSHRIDPDAVTIASGTDGVYTRLVLGEPEGEREIVEQSAWRGFMNTLLGKSRHTGEQPGKAVQVFKERMQAAGRYDWEQVLSSKADNARKLFHQIAGDKQEKVNGGKHNIMDVAALMWSVEALHMLDLVPYGMRGQTQLEYELYGVSVDAGGPVHRLSIELPRSVTGDLMQVDYRGEYNEEEPALGSPDVSKVKKKVGGDIKFIRLNWDKYAATYQREEVTFSVKSPRHK
jgi:hypothetical protein